MDKIALAKNQQRQTIFNDVAVSLNLNPFIVEKDFWVTWVLNKIFQNPELSNILCFKGGTSLSKAFGLIERFSEDIDLILAQHLVLQTGEHLEQKTNNKQATFNKTIEERAGSYIGTTLKDKLDAVLQPVCKVLKDDSDDHVLRIIYPRVFDDGYIQPEIKLEIGPLALWNPNEKYQITSFVAKALPELNLTIPLVPTIKPVRTFWEKITILHHEHYRPESSTVPSRYSRHYYDIFKMAQTDIKQEALQRIDLLKEVISFKKRFYPRGWAKYDEAVPGTLQLMPPAHSLPVFANDYENMKPMIYGDKPQWAEILAFIQTLEADINSLA